MNMEYIDLNSGVRIPQLGLGTLFVVDPDICEQVVLEAFRDGYRHIDTAQIYHNEKYIGKALVNCGLPREELFITTKLWPSCFRKDRPHREIERCLKRLRTDYIDMLLIHHPVGEWKNAWKCMEKMLDEGMVRTIGVSNFNSIRNISEFDTFANVPPAVDQVECHPLHQQMELERYLTNVGIRLEAWFPLGHGNPLLTDQPVLIGLSQKYRKSVQQIILRWHIQSGHIVIPKSTDPRHIKADINVFNFTLADEDMKKINGLDRGNSLQHSWKLVDNLAFRLLR